jgi:hypothetical protein
MPEKSGMEAALPVALPAGPAADDAACAKACVEIIDTIVDNIRKYRCCMAATNSLSFVSRAQKSGLSARGTTAFFPEYACRPL